MIRRLAEVLVVAALMLGGTPLAHAREPAAVEAGVTYRSADHVYLSAGSDQGVQVGQRLAVVRGDREIGLVEVLFVARYSSTCRVVEETIAIAEGDIVRSQAGAAGDAVNGGDAAGALAGNGNDPGQAGTSGTDGVELQANASGNSGADEGNGVTGAGSPAQEVVGETAPRMRQRLSGSFTVGWETFLHGNERGGDYSRLAFRGTLRLRNLGGSPYSVRVQGSSRRISQTGYRLATPVSEVRNRLYEVSIEYDPQGGRFGFSAGRLGTGPFVGNGNLDGVVAEARVTSSLAFGGFFGSVSDVQRIGFDRTKFGAYGRIRTSTAAGGSQLQMLFAGARERDPSGAHRDVAYFETTYRAGRAFSLFQRAELDLNRPLANGNEATVTLATLSVAAFVSVSPRSQFSVTLDRWDRDPRIYDDDGLPLWVNTAARTGVSAAFYFPGPFHSRVSTRAGTRWQEGGAEPLYFGGFSLFAGGAGGVTIGGGLQAFTGALQNGATVNLNVGKRWSGFGIAGSYNRLIPFDVAVDAPDSQWIRIFTDVDLTRRSFVEAGFELSRGPARDGRRFNAGLGYRF